MTQALNPNLRPQSLGQKAAPVAIVESGQYRWFGRNMAWGAAGLSLEEVRCLLPPPFFPLGEGGITVI